MQTWAKITALIIASAALSGVEIAGRIVAVDRPDAWYDPSVSNHGKHFLMGVPGGLVSAAIDDPVTRYAASFTAGAVVGLGWELYMSREGRWINPVDAAWVVAGSLVTTALVDLTGQAFSVTGSDSSVALSYTYRH